MSSAKSLLTSKEGRWALAPPKVAGGRASSFRTALVSSMRICVPSVCRTQRAQTGDVAAVQHCRGRIVLQSPRPPSRDIVGENIVEVRASQVGHVDRSVKNASALPRVETTYLVILQTAI